MLNKNEFDSQFDENTKLTDGKVGLTLIRDPKKEFGIFAPRHAMLGIELVENGVYTAYLADLINPYTQLESIEAVVTSNLGHGKDTHVRWLTMHKPIKFYEKTQTWVVSREQADLMLNEIKDEAEGKKELPAFYLLGGKSVMTYFTNYQRHGKPARNCIHWTLDKLRLAGINLSQSSFNLATDTASYTSHNNIQLNPYGIRELCDFIKLGEIEAIRRFFPPQNPNVDLNELVSGDVGSVELQLRNYTPLMLACGYGHWKIAEMLINEYGADVKVQTKRGFSPKQWLLLSYNALDCAKKSVFGITKIAKEDGDLKHEVIRLIKEKMQQKETPKNMKWELA